MDVTLEAALISTIVSTVVSLLATFLSIKFGPNYKKEIADLNTALTKVFEEQSKNTELMEARFAAERDDRQKTEKERAQRDTESRWRPTARIEVATWNDTRLILKGDREFSVESVALLSANGAALAEIPLKQGGMAVKSTGFAIQVPQSEIVKVWNDSQGPRSGQMHATVRIMFSAQDVRGTVELPVMGKQDFENVPPATTQAYIRLIG